MFGVAKLAGRGIKSVAAGRSQADIGLQSPHLPSMMVRVGRFLYATSAAWITVAWYTGFVNMRTQPGSGPKLLLSGAVIGSPDRPNRTPKFAGVGAQSLQGVSTGSSSTPSTGGPNAPGGPTAGLPGNLPGSGKAGGFLPRGAIYNPGRADQGRDGSTNPGGPIIAPGGGVVVRNGVDPNGFGPKYPIVKFNSGPFSGRTMYIGHTISQLSPGQSFKAGDILSYTGGKTYPMPIGNATVPGWFEIGFADGGNPGPMGQPTPF